MRRPFARAIELTKPFAGDRLIPENSQTVASFPGESFTHTGELTEFAEKMGTPTGAGLARLRLAALQNDLREILEAFNENRATLDHWREMLKATSEHPIQWEDGDSLTAQECQDAIQNNTHPTEYWPNEILYWLKFHGEVVNNHIPGRALIRMHGLDEQSRGPDRPHFFIWNPDVFGWNLYIAKPESIPAIIQALSKVHDLLRDDPEAVYAELAEGQTSGSNASDSAGLSMHVDNGRVLVSWRGNEFPLKSTEGNLRLARIVSRPGELCAWDYIGGGNAGSKANTDELSIVEASQSVPMLNSHEVRETRKAIAGLRELATQERGKGNIDKADELEEQANRYKSMYFNRRNKPRIERGAANKLANTIRTNLKNNTIRTITETHPSLGAHLKAALIFSPEGVTYRP